MYQHIESSDGSPPSTSMDVYSYGCIIQELYSKRRVWGNKNQMELMGCFYSGQFPSYDNLSLPVFAKNILSKVYLPGANRIGFREILKLIEV